MGGTYDFGKSGWGGSSTGSTRVTMKTPSKNTSGLGPVENSLGKGWGKAALNGGTDTKEERRVESRAPPWKNNRAVFFRREWVRQGANGRQSDGHTRGGDADAHYWDRASETEVVPLIGSRGVWISGRKKRNGRKKKRAKVTVFDTGRNADAKAKRREKRGVGKEYFPQRPGRGARGLIAFTWGRVAKRWRC